MNTNFPDQSPISNAHSVVFSALRAKLSHEVSSSAMLADLLEKVGSMQEAHARPEVFKDRFDEFVYRAQEYIGVVRPFFPILVGFLPSHLADIGEPHSPECFAQSAKSKRLALTS